jgi:rSAM/selenodomain-associated transferase 1
MSTALILFAKAPEPGHAKTRLAPALGELGAAVLAERLLVHAAVQAVVAGFDAVELCVTPDTRHPTFRRLATAHGFALTLQGEGDLGARMARATSRALTRHARVVLIGTDAPALDGARLAGARAPPNAHQAVFVPAYDGAYALLGLDRAQPGLFDDMAWSTADVMTHTLERTQARGLSVAVLEPVTDIDEPSDLIHLPPSWGIQARCGDAYTSHFERGEHGSDHRPQNAVWREI